MSLVLTDDRTPFDIINGKAKGTRGDAWSIQSPRAFRKRALMVVDALRAIGAGWSRIDDGGDLETAGISGGLQGQVGILHRLCTCRPARRDSRGGGSSSRRSRMG